MPKYTKKNKSPTSMLKIINAYKARKIKENWHSKSYMVGFCKKNVIVGWFFVKSGWIIYKR